MSFKDAKKRNTQKGDQDQLIKNITKKIQTVMIGSLASIEDNLGHLWGHGTPDEYLSETELEIREKWFDARERILDLGNDKKKAAEYEIGQYTVSWNRYHTEFIIQKRGQDERV
jgi:hypothetical protein